MKEKSRNKIKSILKKCILARRRYHLGKDWRALAESCTSKDNLSLDQKNKIKNFYKPYIKDVSTVFHNYYYEKTGEFDIRYLPDDLYYNYIDRYYNKWDEAVFFDNKCYYEKYFPTIEHPVTIAKRINNIWLDNEWNLLGLEDVLDILNKETSYFVKIAVDSDSGNGVFHFNSDSKIAEVTSIFAKTDRDIIIQRAVKQSEACEKLNETSVNTIRCLTLLRKDDVKICSMIIKIGGVGSVVDNNHSGGVSCGIDDDGRLKKYSYDNFGKKDTVTPDGNTILEGYQLFGIDKVVDVAKKAACQIPHFRLVSWDFAIDENNEPVLIEANLKYGGMDFHQLNNGPLFGNDTVEILNEVFGK